MKRALLALIFAAMPLIALASSLEEGSAAPAGAGQSAKFTAEAAASFLTAAQERDAETLKAMLGGGFDPNYTDEFGQSAIIFSILAGDAAGVDILLDAGANPNTLDRNGNPILPVAAGEGYLEIVQSLIKKGADVNRPGNRGYTALTDAAGKDHLDIVKALIDAGADPDIAAEDGVTPVWAASSDGLAQVAAYLLPLSKNVNVKETLSGRTLLITMIEWKQAALVKALLERGVDVNAPDARGWTPLMWAAKSDDAEITRMLLKKGADPAIHSVLNETALAIAKKENHTAVAALLSKAKGKHKK